MSRTQPLLFLLLFALAPAASGQHTREVEPNDSLATASRAVLEDTLVGTISRLYERDFFVLQLPAGIRLRMDRHRSPSGSRVEMFLLDSTGRSVARMYDSDGASVEYTVARGGRHYILMSVWDHDDPNARDHEIDARYSVFVTATPAPQGPGDPKRAVALLPPTVWYVADADSSGFWGSPGSGITRYGFDGTTRVLVDELISPGNNVYTIGNFTIDGFGDLLVPTIQQATRAGNIHDGCVVWRVSTSTGAHAPFGPKFPETEFNSGYCPYDVAVTANGDVWIASWRRIWRLSPLGDMLDSLDMSTFYVRQLAVSQDGDLRFVLTGKSSGTPGGVYRLVGGSFELLAPVDSAHWYEDIVFDRDGYSYVTTLGAWDERRITVYDPSYRVVERVFAHLTYDTGKLMLPRGSGAVTPRLLAIEPGRGSGPDTLVEFNPNAIRSPGPELSRLHPIELAVHSTAIIGLPYSDTLRMAGAPGASWSLVLGSLPPGVTLVEQSGELSGVPQNAGLYTFSVRSRSGDRYGFGRFKITVAPMRFAVEDLVSALIGGTSLPENLAQLLDQQGNKNGKFDVGDLRAYLRAQGQLAPSKN